MFARKTLNCCGWCGAKRSSANIILRTPISKQRNDLTADDVHQSGADGAAKQGGLGDDLGPGIAERQGESLNAASLSITCGAVPHRRRSRSCRRSRPGGLN